MPIRPNNPVMMSAVANTGTKVSTAIDARQIYSGSIQATFTDGAAAGTLILQGSNDPIEELPAGEAPQNWSTVPNASATVSSGATTLITCQWLNYRWLRASWAQSGGAGTLNVNGFFQAY